MRKDCLLRKRRKTGGRLVYIASGTATDPEMQARIETTSIKTVPIITGRRLNNRQSWKKYCLSFNTGDYVLWDCVTTWLANELYDGWESGTPCIEQPGCMEQKVTRDCTEQLNASSAKLRIS